MNLAEWLVSALIMSTFLTLIFHVVQQTLEGRGWRTVKVSREMQHHDHPNS